MKEIKRIFKRLNMRDFSLYLFFSILLVVTLVAIGKFDITQARYESEATVSVEPDLAFFIVDVGTTSGHVKIDGIVPSAGAVDFDFTVSNFNATKHAEVDLTYTIEIVTTTNMPLDFEIYKGANSNVDIIDNDYTTTDANGVYYRHLVVNDVTTMAFNQNVTDTYKLSVTYPLSAKDNPDAYAGIIDLVDVVIRAEQVV